jgi:hypothetical protein
MSKAKDLALGLFMLFIGVAALLQVLDVDPVWRYVSICALSGISILGAGVFFIALGSRT